MLKNYDYLLIVLTIYYKLRYNKSADKITNRLYVVGTSLHGAGVTPYRGDLNSHLMTHNSGFRDGLVTYSQYRPVADRGKTFREG